ncbi:MAG: hypothetical protein ABJR05_03295 [Balneola sp.]
MKNLLILFLIAGLAACADTKKEDMNTKSLAEKVDFFLENDQYSDALTLLESQEENEEVMTLKEKTHLNYGLFLEYRDSNVTNMRDKMNGALAQYVEVLKINPDNEKAVSEIEQILGIYSTFEDRKPDEKIAEELRKLGFEV